MAALYINPSLLQEFNVSFTGDRMNDIRVIGVMLVIILLIIALVGLDWEAIVRGDGRSTLPLRICCYPLSICKHLHA